MKKSLSIALSLCLFGSLAAGALPSAAQGTEETTREIVLESFEGYADTAAMTAVWKELYAFDTDGVTPSMTATLNTDETKANSGQSMKMHYNSWIVGDKAVEAEIGSLPDSDAWADARSLKAWFSSEYDVEYDVFLIFRDNQYQMKTKGGRGLKSAANTPGFSETELKADNFELGYHEPSLSADEMPFDLSLVTGIKIAVSSELAWSDHYIDDLILVCAGSGEEQGPGGEGGGEGGEEGEEGGQPPSYPVSDWKVLEQLDCFDADKEVPHYWVNNSYGDNLTGSSLALNSDASFADAGRSLKITFDMKLENNVLITREVSAGVDRQAKAFRFWAKGTREKTQVKIDFCVNQNGTAYTAEKCLTISSEGRFYEIPFDSLVYVSGDKQVAFSPDILSRINFEVREPAGTKGELYFDSLGVVGEKTDGTGGAQQPDKPAAPSGSPDTGVSTAFIPALVLACGSAVVLAGAKKRRKS
ncbi:MAG TPA: hypothetical protein H9684_02695 [Firmicutes bacterium]|nr:hypothetical protein [Bacillota bacterium]